MEQAKVNMQSICQYGAVVRKSAAMNLSLWQRKEIQKLLWPRRVVCACKH